MINGYCYPYLDKPLCDLAKSYRDRWRSRDSLIREIIELMRKGDESWNQLIPWGNHTGTDNGRRDLKGIPLMGYDLRGINFKDLDMSFSDLRNTLLNGATFEYVVLRYADISGAVLYSVDFQRTDLIGACLENIKVDDKIDWGTDFQSFIHKRKQNLSYLKYLWTQQFIRFMGYKGKIYSEQIAKNEEEINLTQKVYGALRTAYLSVNIGISRYFDYRENYCERIGGAYSKLNPFTWVGILWEKISCCGTAPARFVFFVIGYILLFACIYAIFPKGIVRENNIAISGFGQAIYFSVVTFTTLGYGDFHPNLGTPLGNYLSFICILETFTGMILSALAVAIFIRFMIKE